MTPADLKVTHHFVTLPSLRMHYVEVGAGPLVVLLHGFPESWWSWRYQLQALADAGFRVVAPDLRGYGETDKRGPFDLDTLAGDVCHLIEALGERRAQIVGHDWGGALAWHLASHRPEFCARLAVLNCPHPLAMRKALLARPSWAQLKRSWYFFFFQLPWLPEWLLTRGDAGNLVRVIKASSVDRSHFSPEELRPLRDAIQRPGAATAMVNWYRDAVRLNFARPLTQPVYPLITRETLLIWGMEDPALGFHELVPGTEAYAPKLRVEQVKGCGHFVQSERPADVNRLLLGFLRASPATA
jgi:pimeloyl-ACP methyl ester carboxylesterase